ncbi:hypothetical protein [Priestia flexa]|uniref:hypothetical protein n=1 Tax=Priestia flexa TaxID=86664 RepID=UPI00077CD6C9|nr:hypothetical protein [Priestia flexa]MED4587642.1 hypothetical protein [Priestia flexa]
MKQVMFTLFEGQETLYKSLVESSVQSKVLRNYLLNEYQLPNDLTIFSKPNVTGLKNAKFYFDQFTDEKLNNYVSYVKEKGFKANRSSIMRHVIGELISKLQGQNSKVSPVTREVKKVDVYFEKGTKAILENFINFRDRNATLERFILEEYEPKDLNYVMDKLQEPEQMKVGMDIKAFEKLDKLVDQINKDGVNRSVLFRDVVNKLISKLSNSDARQLIAEKRLEYAITDVIEVSGYKHLVNLLTDYIHSLEKKHNVAKKDGIK